MSCPRTAHSLALSATTFHTRSVRTGALCVSVRWATASTGEAHATAERGTTCRTVDATGDISVAASPVPPGSQGQHNPLKTPLRHADESASAEL